MKRKRFLSILISLVMAASLVTPAFAVQTPTTLQINVQGDSSRKNPIVTWPTAMITYGQVLTSQSFTGGSAKDKTNGEIISGTFTIDNLPADLLDANNDINTHYSFTATFTPTDTSFYNTIQGTAIAIVNKAKAAINITGGTYTYDGQAHGATGTAIGINNEDLSSLLKLGDTFTDYPGGTAQWTFTGNNNYKSDQGSVSININKADAAIKVAGGTYTYDSEPHGATGTATGVNHEDLNNLLTITGTFTNVPGGTANWSFAGSNNYNSASGSADIVINKADAAITLSNLTQAYDGTAKAVAVATDPTGLNYDVTYKQGDTEVQSPINAGSYDVEAAINENNYKGTVYGQLVIDKAASTTMVTVTDVTYDGKQHGGTAFVTGAGGLNQNLAITYTGKLNDGTSYSSTDAPTEAGQYTATAAYEGDGNHTASSDTKSFIINKAEAAIKVAGGSYTYDGEPHGATGTATGINLEDLTNLLTITGSFIDYPGGTADWLFAGNNNYKSDSGSVDIVINKADAAITLSNLTQTYDGAAKAVTVTTVPTGLNYDVTYKQGDVGVKSPINAGTYEVVVTINENNYKGTAQSQLVIDKAPSTTTVTAANAIYDGKQHGGTAFVAGAGGLSQSLPITYTGKTWDGTDYTSTAAPAEAGQYTATAAFEGDDNHYGSSGNEPFVINKAPAEINVAGGSYTYDGEPHGATGTATGVKGEDLSNLLTITGTFINVPGGTANWSFAGNNNYQYAEGSVVININKANATINIPEVICTYDGKPHGATGTATGVKGEDLSNLLIITGSFIDVPGGTANWSFAGNNNYNSSSGKVSIVINKADAGITLSNLSQTYDGSAKSVIVTTDPTGLNYDVTYKQGDVEIQSPTNAGNYDVEAAINENNYKGTTQGQLVIDKAPSTTIVTVADAAYDGKQHGATASVTGAGGLNQNLTITYTGKLNDGTSYSSTDAPTEAGQYTASAAYDGDDNHCGSSGTKSFVINKADADIKVDGVTCTYDGKPHGATGTAAGVKGEDLNNLLIITGSFIDVPGGTASWLFSGNNNYNSASGSAAIVINKADAEITLSNLTQTYDGAAKAVTVTTIPTGLNYDVTYKQGDTEVQSPTNAGTYEVVATINDNNYKGTAQGQFVIDKAPSTTIVTVTDAAYDGKQHGGTASVTGAGGLSQNLPIAYTGITSSGASYSSTAVPIEPGQYTATATFEGDDNHTGSHDSKNFAITYTWSGFLQPIDSDRSTAFKLGSTIPVKFSLTGTSVNITNAAAKIYYAKVNNDTPDTDIEPISTSAATTGNLFRYDSTSGQYIFNLSTKNTATTPFTTGTYQIKIDLGDGVNRTINISLK